METLGTIIGRLNNKPGGILEKEGDIGSLAYPNKTLIRARQLGIAYSLLRKSRKDIGDSLLPDYLSVLRKKRYRRIAFLSEAQQKKL